MWMQTDSPALVWGRARPPPLGYEEVCSNSYRILSSAQLVSQSKLYLCIVVVVLLNDLKK